MLRDHASLDTAVVGHEDFVEMFAQDSKGIISKLIGNAHVIIRINSLSLSLLLDTFLCAGSMSSSSSLCISLFL